MCFRLVLVLATVFLAPTLLAQPSETDQRLLVAATAGDVSAMRDALRGGGNPEAADTSGATALMLATRSGRLDAVRALVDAGADPSRKGVLWLNEERTSYYGNLTSVAAGEGHTDMLAYLIDDLGIPVDDRERDPATGEDTGWTALQWAASAGQAEVVTMLLERGAVVDRVGDTLLLLAIRNDHSATAEMLLEAGAPAVDVSPDGMTALHWAAARLPATWVNRLVAGGADVNATSNQDLTPLHIAALVGNEPFVQLLVCTGAQGVETALALAEERGHNEVGAFLVEVVRSGSPDAATCAEGEAGALSQQVVAHFNDGRNEEAIKLAQDALTLRETTHGVDHLEVAFSLNHLARLLYTVGEYTKAQPLYERALAIRESALGPDHTDVAISLNNLAALLEARGDYAGAWPLHERALAIRENVLGPNHHDVAASLNNLGGLLRATGDLEGAQPHLERALEIWETTLGPDHPNVATSLNNLAALLKARGDYTGAWPLHERALAIWETSLGPDHPDVAISLNNLAGLLYSMGDYPEARSLLERALRINEAALGSDHPIVATSLNNLASILEAMGDYPGALSLTEQALALRENVFGESHPDVAISLNDLAGLLHAMRDYPGAQPLYERALEIREAALGPDHPDVAVSLNDLAGLLQAKGDYARARPLLERALALRETALSPQHPYVALSLNNLAGLLSEVRDYTGARSLYDRALAIWEVTLGPNHPDVASSLNNIAFLLLMTGDDGGARSRFERAGRILDTQLPLVLPTLSFAEQAAYLKSDIANQTNILLVSHRASDHLGVVYPLLARWKGLLLHSLRSQTEVNALAANPVYVDDVAALQAVRTNLVAWQDRAGTLPLEDWQARRDELTAEKERLERTLAAALPEDVFTDPLRADEYPGLPAYLAPGEAFADVFRYAHWERGTFVEYRYAVVLSTSSDDNPVLVDLGNANEIEAAVAAWRDAVTAQRSTNTEQHILAERLWAPLADALPEGTTHLWFSPDGTLARLPLSVLAEGDPRTADLRVTQVASARALVRLRTSERDADREGLLLAGGLDFGTDSTGAALPWLPLPGTAAEVDALAAFADDADLQTTALTGADADPATVMDALPEARYVHLATHGFFATLDQAVLDSLALRGAQSPMRGLSTDDDSFGRSKVLSQRPTTAEERRALSRNPLVESGLALSGANAGSAGTLTAEELVGLDLRGTELVVLSACETGRGSEVTGQGVLGLQASFLSAGARTLLMSLWKVPDTSTAVLMEAFYAGLWEEGLRPAAALHEAQATVREAGYTEPVHWAGWVLAGEAW